MKFLSLLFLVVAVTVSAQENKTATNTTAPAPVPAPKLTPEIECVTTKCAAGDVDCQAKCLNLPNPTAAQANLTVSCVSACNQTDAKAFASCRETCIQKNFLADRPVTPGAPSSSSSNSTSKNGTTGSEANNTTSSAIVGAGMSSGLIVGAVSALGVAALW